MARVEGVDPGHVSDEHTAKVLAARANPVVQRSGADCPGVRGLHDHQRT